MTLLSSLGLNAFSATITKETFHDENGKKFKVVLNSYKNHLDELEVRIESASLPRFAAKINPLIGFGRDTDGDQKIDTWFLITKNGIDLVKKAGNDPLGKDVLEEILIKKYRSTFMMYVTSATTSIMSYLFISVGEGSNVEENYYRDWMDLEEMRMQFEEDFNDMGSAYNYSQMMYHYQLSSIGYKDLADRTEAFAKRSFWGYAFADVGLWITGGVVFNWGAKILSKIGVIASESVFLNAVKETFYSFFSKHKGIIEGRAKLFKDKLNTTKVNVGMKVAEKELVAVLTVATWKMALKNTIKSQKIKKKLLIAVKKSIRFPVAVASGVKSEWVYVAMNSTVQIGSEAVARYSEIRDDNPAVAAKNLLTNPEVIENVGFMAAETMLMTGISKNLKTTKARFMASGAVALTDSSILNFAIKDDANISRVAFDTTWEVLIGNAQVQMDLKALEYFEKMALKKGNPKIKLIGYVVALLDMGVGYVTYSKATSAIEKHEKDSKGFKEVQEPKVTLIPILAEMP